MIVDPIKNYGIREQSIATDDIDIKLQELDLRGYTTLDSGFSASDLREFSERLDSLLSEQGKRVGGENALQRLNEANTLRAPLFWDQIFLAVAIQPQLIEICRRVFGDYFILNQQNGVRNPPVTAGHHQAAYHRDLPYQHFVSTRPLALNALLCLDPFTSENGATRMIPGSHKVEYYPDDRVVRSLEQVANVSAGTYLILNSMVYHCAGINGTETPRRAINNVITLPIIKQQIALPGILPEQFTDDPWLKRFLGYEVDPPRSIDAWYESRRRRNT